MKIIILSHYTIKDIEAEPWKETWDNMTSFAERMSPKLLPMGIKLRLRKVILDDITEENLMTGNMVTISCSDMKFKETPIEELLMLDLDFSPCASCVTPDGVGFACRTFKNFDGEECQALPEEFFMEATLRIAFKAQHESGCGCSDCNSCASGCGDEEEGEDSGSCGCGHDC